MMRLVSVVILCSLRTNALRLGEPSAALRSTCETSTDWPTACPQGNNLWTTDEMKALLPEFAKLFQERPIDNNKGGMNLNHAFALWFTTVRLKPKYVIESGVFHGQTTWLLRQAAPEAQIYSLDPRSEKDLTFRDSSNKTRYFMGDNFKDFPLMEWENLIPLEERKNTLVMLDDHMSSIKRTKQLMEHSFIHLWYDDNWNSHYKGSDCYSFNTVCSPAKGEKVLMQDSFGNVESYISAVEHQKNSDWLSTHIEIYFEFPAILDGCSNHPAHKHQRSLLSNEKELLTMGLPLGQGLLHLYPPYVKLKDWRVREGWWWA